VLAVIALVFVVIPLVEIYVAIQVGHVIGALNTIALLIAISIVGAWLAKRAGFTVIQRVRTRLERGEVPGKELVDGLLVLSAGVLLFVPGFVTDAVGVILLLPPVRAFVRGRLRRRFVVQVTGRGPGRGPGPGQIGDGYRGGGVIDV
jgi:UPF0716 protein FxsA